MLKESPSLSKRSKVSMAAYAFFIGLLSGVFSIVYHAAVTQGMASMLNLYRVHDLMRLVVPLIVASFFIVVHQRYLLNSPAFGVGAVRRELADIDNQMMIPKVVLVKLMNTIISLASGFSVGQFGPTIHLGGAIGSFIGYRFKMSPSRVRMLIGCGVAGALSAVMQAPLFATLIVIEVIFNRNYFDFIVPIVISSLSAYALNVFVLGELTFMSFAGVVNDLSLSYDLWWTVLVLAVVLGVVSALYIFTLAITAKIMQAKLSFRVRMLLAGALLGVIAYFVPQVLYTQISIVPNLLKQDWSLGFIGLLILVRLLLTSTQLGANVSGGNFTPGLVIGLLTGVFFYQVAMGLGINMLPLEVILLLSMVGIFSGFAHAPLSASVLAIELTGGGGLIMPILFTALISDLVSELIIDDDAFTLK